MGALSDNMAATYTLFLVLFILFLIALYMTDDFLSPACLVCESFLFSYISAIFSSRAGGWNFSLHAETVFVIAMGLLCFLIGSFFGNGMKRKDYQLQVDKNEIKPLVYNGTFVTIMLFVQCLLLLVYIYYFRKTSDQFSGMDWNTMMRMRRLANAYGEGLEVNIPGFINQSIKLAKVNAYIALYYVMHNVAVHNVNKKEKIKGTKRLLLIIFLYFPYSILQSARFEIFTLLIGGIIIWYIFYQYYSNFLHIRLRNMRKTIRILTVVVIGLLGLMSLLGTLVGRVASETIFSEAFNYMGRTIQALDTYLYGHYTILNGEVRGAESFFGIFKLLGQLGIVDMSNESWYLEFISLGGHSLGNTYTVFRRYFRDFGYFGVIILPFLEGLILSKLYKMAKYPKTKELDMTVIVYSMVGGSSFFYAYEGQFFANVITINYLLIFILAYIIAGIASRRIYFISGLKLKIKRGKIWV
jgi:hypothetical protein